MNKFEACLKIVFTKNFILATEKESYVRGSSLVLRRVERLLQQFPTTVEGMRYEYTIGGENENSKANRERGFKKQSKLTKNDTPRASYKVKRSLGV